VTAPTSFTSFCSAMQARIARPIRPVAPSTATFSNSRSHSLEEALHPVEPAPRPRAVTLAAALYRLVEPTQHLLLLARQVHGRLDLHAAVQVSGSRGTQRAYTLALHAEHLSGLRLRRHLEDDGAVERRHLDRAAQRRGREADRHLAREVLPVAREDRVRFDVNLDVQVARRAAVASGLAFAREPYPIAVVDARRHLHRQGPELADDAAARAVRARLLHARARAAASRTGLLDRQEALLHPDLAVPVARRARDTLRAGRRARAVAGLARDAARKIDLDRIAEDGLLERELEVVAQIRAAKHLRSAARARAENAAEDLVEDVGERIARPEAPAEARAARFDAGVAESIVGRALRAIGQDLVGFLRFLELRLGLGIVRV